MVPVLFDTNIADLNDILEGLEGFIFSGGALNLNSPSSDQEI